MRSYDWRAIQNRRKPVSEYRRKSAEPTTLTDETAVDLRQALRQALPGGADVVVDPVGGDLAEPALRAMRWGGGFVTVGYASGVIPRIPLNLVLLRPSARSSSTSAGLPGASPRPIGGRLTLEGWSKARVTQRCLSRGPV